MIIPEYIEMLVDEGIEITIGKSDDYGIYYNLNTGAKSHLHFTTCSEDGAEGVAHMRYDTEELIFTFEDLLCAVKSCMLGRDYIDNKWESLLIKYGVLKVTTKVIKTFE